MWLENFARFCEKPKMEHCIAVKRVLRYTSGTRQIGLRYFQSCGESVFGHIDSDWAGDVSDRVSKSACVFKKSGSRFPWRSRKEPVAATSSFEDEYIALSMACMQAVLSKRLRLVEL